MYQYPDSQRKQQDECEVSNMTPNHTNEPSLSCGWDQTLPRPSFLLSFRQRSKSQFLLSVLLLTSIDSDYLLSIISLLFSLDSRADAKLLEIEMEIIKIRTKFSCENNVFGFGVSIFFFTFSFHSTANLYNTSILITNKFKTIPLVTQSRLSD